MRGLIAQNVTETLHVDLADTPITEAAWAEILASLKYGVSAIEIFNGSSGAFALSKGAVGEEDDNIVPYTVLPGGSSILVPLNLGARRRLSLKSLNGDVDSGDLVFNFFG